jgi:hypothetical protein
MRFIRTLKSRWSSWRAALTPGALLTGFVFMLAGCSGGSGSGSVGGPAANACTSATCGTVQVALTDADGDFLRYSVGVVALDLTKADGTVVHVLPASTTQVDFAQLVSLTEILTSADLPQGAYNKGSITLDYTNADIEVEVAGQAVKATVTDPDGHPLTQTTLDIRLDDHEPLVVQANHLKLLTLDFNLAASNQVDTTQNPPVVKVSPFLAAEVDPAHQRAVRVRGPLVSVDVAGLSYTVDVRPFDRDDSEHDGDFGQMVVHVDANTSFEVNGVASTGSAGLDALNGLAVGSPTVARGVINIDPVSQAHNFLASTVLAGDSVPGKVRDAILGNVVSRSGNTLMVRGATVEHHGGQVEFNDNVTVTIGPNTDVRRSDDFDDEDVNEAQHSEQPQAQGSSGGDSGSNSGGNGGGNGNGGDKHGGGMPLDISAISVGQRIEVHGTASGSSPVTIDATNGRVRLLKTHLTGTVSANVPGQLTMALASIDRRDVGIFDFTGTGATPAEDANPATYQVNTGALTITAAPGDTVSIGGFVAGFGQATATDDFDAVQVVDDMQTEDHARLVLGWGNSGTTAPFSSVTVDGLALDLGNASLGADTSAHFLFDSGVVTDLKTLSPPFTIVPATSGDTHFAIKQGHSVQVYAGFADFVTALNGVINGTNIVSGLYSEGTYDGAAGSFTGRLILVRIGLEDLH